MVLSSTLYPGVALWEDEWRWLPSLPGMEVLSLPLDLWPCPPPPSWLSTSDVLPEELSCRGTQVKGESVSLHVYYHHHHHHLAACKHNVLQMSSCSFCHPCHPQRRPSQVLSPGQGALGPVEARTELCSVASTVVHWENTCKAQHNNESGLEYFSQKR